MPFLFKKSSIRPTSASDSQQSQLNRSNFKSFRTPIITRQNSDTIFMNETITTKVELTAYSQPSLKTCEKDQIVVASSSAPNIEGKKHIFNTTQLKRTMSNVSSIDVHLSFEDVSEEETFDTKDKSFASNHINEPKIKEAHLQFMKKKSESPSDCDLTPPFKIQKSQKSVIAPIDSSPPLTRKSQDNFTKFLERSLAEINKTVESLKNNESKEELLPEVNKKGQTTKELKTPSLDLNSEVEHFTLKKEETNTNKYVPSEKSNIKNISHEGNLSQEDILSLDSSQSLSQEVLNQKDVKEAFVSFMNSELENDEDFINFRKGIQMKNITSSGEESINQSFKEAKMTSIKAAVKDKKKYKRKDEENDQKYSSHQRKLSKEEVFSLDSSQSLSQEVLNRKDVKAAFVNFMNSELENDEDIINFSKMKHITSSDEEPINQSFEKSKRTNIKAAVKEKRNYKRGNKKNNRKYTSHQQTPSHEEILSLNPSISMSDEDLNKKYVKAENYKNITLRRTIRTKENNIIQSSKQESINRSFKKTRDTKGKPAVKAKKMRNRKNEELDNKKNSHKNLTLQKRMSIIHDWRDVGLYVLCDICDKARYLPDVNDPLDLPQKWYCRMHPDKKYNKCNYLEVVEEQCDYLIDNLYNSGSIVWAKMDGYPWWPAMVEDDVDTETYFLLEENSSTPARYHVTLLDPSEIIREWMRPSCLIPFKINMNNPRFQTPNRSIYKSRVSAAFKLATDAIGLPLIDRLKKYSFVYRSIKPLKRANEDILNISKKKINELEGNESKKMKKNLGHKVSSSGVGSQIPVAISAISLENQLINANNADEFEQFITNFNLVEADNMSFKWLD